MPFIGLKTPTRRRLRRAGPYGVIDERELFRLLAHPGVFAHKATGRRHLILDGIAFAIGVLRMYGFKGAVLDVGCHIGTTIDVMARLVPNKIVGIDPVGAAIDTARRLTSGLQNVELHRAMLPWETETKFDLITCYDVLHHIPILRQPRLIDSLGSLVEDGGALIVSGPSFVDPEWLAMARPAFEMAHLGYIDCDLFGGFGGAPPSFGGTAAALFRKGEASPIPDDLKDLSNREWNEHFQLYANAADTLGREKTQAFERAMRTRQKGLSSGR
jgi:SAM-dependent methyltransferase